ncbi:phospholipase, patatin family protein [Cardiosporidium cionae]|uniref:Phospholipase, patatin family protein n=1 Tax=Cardiosporidium cionae TaxID=476202 RepID=A0ABQ7J758_9APIC|nr:phospholipase, patatin family protein [Cardiosporidium cionae]|eukprot:KAF8819801.1 phospholipase, patatin family protein [Cardiosporidium cionae]
MTEESPGIPTLSPRNVFECLAMPRSASPDSLLSMPYLAPPGFFQEAENWETFCLSSGHFIAQTSAPPPFLSLSCALPPFTFPLGPSTQAETPFSSPSLVSFAEGELLVADKCISESCAPVLGKASSSYPMESYSSHNRACPFLDTQEVNLKAFRGAVPSLEGTAPLHSGKSSPVPLDLLDPSTRTVNDSSAHTDESAPSPPSFITSTYSSTSIGIHGPSGSATTGRPFVVLEKMDWMHLKPWEYTRWALGRLFRLDMHSLLAFPIFIFISLLLLLEFTMYCLIRLLVPLCEGIYFRFLPVCASEDPQNPPPYGYGEDLGEADSDQLLMDDGMADSLAGVHDSSLLRDPRDVPYLNIASLLNPLPPTNCPVGTYSSIYSNPLISRSFHEPNQPGADATDLSLYAPLKALLSPLAVRNSKRLSICSPNRPTLSQEFSFLWPLKPILSFLWKSLPSRWKSSARSPPSSPPASLIGTTTRKSWRFRSAFDRARLTQEVNSRRLHCQNFSEYVSCSEKLDELTFRTGWKYNDDSHSFDCEAVKKRLRQLKERRLLKDIPNLVATLKHCVHFEFAGIFKEHLYSRTYVGTKHIIEEFIDEVVTCLNLLEYYVESHSTEIRALLQHVSGQWGSTCLILSGGAALALYHFGVCDVLLKESPDRVSSLPTKIKSEGNLLPRIICGTSAGAAIAAWLCTRTDEEIREGLRADYLCKVFRGFSPNNWLRRFWNILKRGYMCDVDVWQNSVFELYGDMTFLEAYQRTGRILNISLTRADRCESVLVLSYKNAPNVVIFSAVNPHVFPFCGLRAHGEAGIPINWRGRNGQWRAGFLLSGLELFFKENMRFLLRLIALLDLSPTCRGINCGSLALQSYVGDVTVHPPGLTFKHLKLANDPSQEDVEWYVREGRQMTFPKLSFIINRVRIDHALERLFNLLSRNESPPNVFPLYVS